MALRAQTFLGRINTEALSLMDDHISHWIEKSQIEPKHIFHVFGYERSHSGEEEEPVLITTIWY